jgi:cold shock protein
MWSLLRKHRDAGLSATSPAQPLESAVSEGIRKGTVLWFDRDRRYGIIKAVGGNVIVHQTAVERSGLIGLVPGQEIEFRLGPWGGYHMRADNLRLIAACAE